MLPTQNIDSLLRDLNDDKAMALFLGAGTDVTECYPGHDGSRSALRNTWYNSPFCDKHDRRAMYKKYKEKINMIKKDNDKEKLWSLNWNSLLAELKNNATLNKEEFDAWDNSGLDNPMQAALLKYKLKNRYIPIIKDWLYSRCNHQILLDSLPYYKLYMKSRLNDGDILKILKNVPFYTLFVLADLILRKPSIRAVFTQNYNNFLSDAINILWNSRVELGCDDVYKGRQPIDVYDGWKDKKYTDYCLLIYHVHGYIPPSSEMKPKNISNHIVLTHEEFNSLSHDVYSWQNASQLHYLTHHTCLLCGLSLNDLTSLRLLNHANLERSSEKVYWLTAGLKNSIEELKARYFESQHLTVIHDAEGYPHFYHVISSEIAKKDKATNQTK